MLSSADPERIQILYALYECPRYEAAATEGWKYLIAESVPNLYILENGVKNWLNIFADEPFQPEYQLPTYVSDARGYNFDLALGAQYPAADPNPNMSVLSSRRKFSSNLSTVCLALVVVKRVSRHA